MTLTAPRGSIPSLKVNSLIPDLSVMKNPSGILKLVNPAPPADLVACRLHVVRDGHQTIALRYEVRVTCVRTSSAILTETIQGPKAGHRFFAARD